MATWALYTAPAWAENIADVNKNAARQFATEGVARYQQGDWRGAWDLFHRANELVHAPTLAVWEARALDKLGALVAAEERYLEATRASLGADAPPAFAQAVAEATEELRKLRPRIPSVELIVANEGAKAPGLTVKRNGELVKPALLGVRHSVDPGRHEIVATAPNMKSARAILTLAEGAQEVVTLSLEPLSPSQPGPVQVEAPAAEVQLGESSPVRTLAWVSLGVGAVGVGVGVVTGLMAAGEHSTAEEACTRDVCVDGGSGSEAVDKFRTLRTVSTVGYVVGALGAGVGTYLFLTTPDSKTAAGSTLRPWLGLGSAGVRGAF